MCRRTVSPFQTGKHVQHSCVLYPFLALFCQYVFSVFCVCNLAFYLPVWRSGPTKKIDFIEDYHSFPCLWMACVLLSWCEQEGACACIKKRHAARCMRRGIGRRTATRRKAHRSKWTLIPISKSILSGDSVLQAALPWAATYLITILP
jgi:hypothetical protein